ncbi:Metallo-dependent phosphatase [Aureobasidium subglaciale]|nr:Metallo-dependent phosphatase [Aureobasidium subglaciale]
MSSEIRTRFVIISDTHGENLDCKVPDSIDVLIHCGDLTEESKLYEYKQVISLLSSISAPVKLVIAGNADFTLDDTLYQQKLTEARLSPPQEDTAVKEAYGDFGEARALFDAERAAGIIFLDEGTHKVELANGACLKVYASPFTPSDENNWGYPYDPHPGHAWNIEKGVDIMITHSPPKGVLDLSRMMKGRAGCPMLFSAIAKARPLMHCFGHIHEAWGAKSITWRGDEASDFPTHLTEIDGHKSEVIQSLAKLKGERLDAEENVELKEKLDELDSRGCCYATPELLRGKQTLFVNAAIQGAESEKQQMPWFVQLDLPGSKKIL